MRSGTKNKCRRIPDRARCAGVSGVTVWQQMFGSHGEHLFRLAMTVSLSLVGVVLRGTFTGSMLPFVVGRLRADPAASSAPFVATPTDVTGLEIYLTIVMLVVSATLL